MAVSQALRVPFVDLGSVHEPLRAELHAELDALLDSSAFVNGPPVAAFEQAFAEAVGVEHAVGVASGLDALRLALVAAGLERGDEVVVPAHTFVATYEAVVQAGGTPVPVDVSEADYCLDADAAEAALTPRARVLLPVDLYGHPADLRRLRSLAARHGLDLVEDACQAHGAARDGVRAGAGGLAGAFSFYPGKNLGALGDAGAVTTPDAGLAARVRQLREHGQAGKYVHERIGWTARLDSLQAAFLLRKLPLLERWNAGRRAVAAAYLEALAGVGDLELPPAAPGAEHAWHLFVVRTARPAELAAHLGERGIATGRHYPHAVPLLEPYAAAGVRAGAFPVAEALAAEGLSLPLYPGMSPDQVDAVVDAVRGYFDG